MTDWSGLAFKVGVWGGRSPFTVIAESGVVIRQLQVNFRCSGLRDSLMPHRNICRSRLAGDGGFAFNPSICTIVYDHRQRAGSYRSHGSRLMRETPFLPAGVVIFRIYGTAGAGQRHVVVWLWSNR